MSDSPEVSAAQVLEVLTRVLEERRGADPEHSYVARLHADGLDAILRKVGEEAVETILAGRGDDAEALVYETADLWFHTLVLLAHKGLGARDVLEELARRTGVSGIEEKRSRRR